MKTNAVAFFTSQSKPPSPFWATVRQPLGSFLQRYRLAGPKGTAVRGKVAAAELKGEWLVVGMSGAAPASGAAALGWVAGDMRTSHQTLAFDIPAVFAIDGPLRCAWM